MQETEETWVRLLGGEDPLEVGMATQSGILAWRNHGKKKTAGFQSIGLQRVRYN